jgi:aminopeptidase N
MSWFDDVWLKEVFANFMAAKIVNPAFPEVNHELNFLMRHQPAAYGEDRSQGTHPIQQSLANLNEAGTLYGRIIYQKAPVVMRQLEAKIGEQNLRDGLREYLKTFAYGNASWDDLIAILDDRTEEDLQLWSKVWVKSAGMPVFQAVFGHNDEDVPSYTLSYYQAEQASGYWSEKTEIAVFYSDSVARLPFELAADKASSLLNLGEVKPLAILSNASPMSYGYFPLDENSQQYFLQHMNEITDPFLRGAAWIALYEDFLNKQMALEVFFTSVLAAIPLENNQLNRSYLLATLERLYWQFLNQAEREIYAPEVEEMLRNAYVNANSGGEQIAFFRTYYKTALSPASIDELYNIWETQQITPSLALTESESIDLIAELALRRPKDAAKWLNTQSDRTTNNDRKDRLAFISGGLLYNHSARDAFFAGFKHPENRETEPWVVDAAAYLNHPLHYPYSEDYLQRSLELMEEIQATGDIFFPRQFITATLSGHQSAKAAKIVEDFLLERPDYPQRLKNKILMAADLLFRTSYENN